MCRLSLIVLLCSSALALGQGKAPTRASPDLAPVLGAGASSWQAERYIAAKPDFAVADIKGRKAIVVGPQGLTLASTSKLEENSEIRLRFRLTSPEDKGTHLAVAAGVAKKDAAENNPLALQLAVNPGAEPEAMAWSLPALPDSKQGSYGTYFVRNLPGSRLTWPDWVRKRVEMDSASDGRITERWVTLRYQLRKHGYRIFLDDRLLQSGQHPRLESAGFVRLHFSRGAEIASLAVLPLPPEDPRFQSVALDGYVNSGSILGQVVRLDKAAPKGTLQVGGVPFHLSAANEQGQDHVALKPSWLKFGALEGDFYGGDNELPRWGGALSREPSRFQFRIPNGKYTKLHLLAAYSGEPDTTPIVTAQFYRPNAGHPVNFAGRVPAFTAASEARSVAVGGNRHLHALTIPLDPNGAAAFSDLDQLEFELTKEVRTYRSFPDPIQYSAHCAGLPSGVHVFAITFERPAVEVDFQPDNFAHVWTAPAAPGYSARLKNITAHEQSVALDLTTASYDGEETTRVPGAARLAPGAEQVVKLPVTLKKFGHHKVTLKVHCGGETQTQERSLAYLHPDTRERGNWEEGKGPIFGLWDWAGGHLTPAGINRLKLMAAAGLESSMQSFTADTYPPEEKAFLESIGAKTFFLAYQLSMNKDTLGGNEWDPKKPAEMQSALIAWLKKQPMAKPTKINKPELAVFFAEPLLGPVSYMSQPEHYGEPPHQLTAEERAVYQKMLDQFVIAASAIKKEWPTARCLMPWGLPSFVIPFLRESKEARDLMDGPALDVVLFERLPEMQLHQVTISSAMWQLKQDWLKTGKPWPTFSTIEGPAVSPARPGALTSRQEMDHTLRIYMLLAAYGTTRHLGWPSAAHCAGYWGETHYGGGLCEPLPLLSPRPVYAAYATMTRQLNRMNFVKTVPTGSNTVFCSQFKHCKTGELLHVAWTLRGQRDLSLAVAPGTKISVCDAMDNAETLSERGGRISATISTTPSYIRGLTADPRIALGFANHSDTVPAEDRVSLGNLGDGSWKLSSARDATYENSHAEFIRRFPGKFSVRPVPVDEFLGSTALSVHLEKQDRERKTMPFYTTLVPGKPIVIPGKPSHLGLWVKAASDWGRVVYCLRDARGERWISVGQSGEWNVDDTHCWSQFCFDGWRYLRFEMPGNMPYDAYRDIGTTFWGHYGQGDGLVDYPLTLEKIIVERRTHVIAGTELVAASPDDVLLGELFAEYEKPGDLTAEAVRLVNLRMPTPASAPELANPLVRLNQMGSSDGPAISGVAPPEREYDGKRCVVHFAPVADAKTYDIWVSPYPDGRGAVRLAHDWKKPDELLTGLSPNVDLYLYAVANYVGGKQSKPGKGYKINLKDMFPMK